MNETATPTDTITCACGASAPRPPSDGRSWAPLWDAGWRWKKVTPTGEPMKFMPSETVYSCPACSPVI
ncbi:hypothetical protein [Streptomyces sp. NPDC018584]|uniref:hypothetical protein n=1 Tax=unclassified Streptomyces TaxID=2593676 RepID=UPI0037AF12CD